MQTTNNYNEIVSGTLVQLPDDKNIYTVGEVYAGKVNLYLDGKLYATVSKIKLQAL